MWRYPCPRWVVLNGELVRDIPLALQGQSVEQASQIRGRWCMRRCRGREGRVVEMRSEVEGSAFERAALAGVGCQVVLVDEICFFIGGDEVVDENEAVGEGVGCWRGRRDMWFWVSWL